MDEDEISNDNPTQRTEPAVQHIGNNEEYQGLAHENFNGIDF